MPETPPKNADPRLCPAPQGRTSLTIMLMAGALTATLFGSRVLLQEIQSDPVMVGYETIRHLGMLWDNAMQEVQATAPDKKLHDDIREVEGKKF